MKQLSATIAGVLLAGGLCAQTPAPAPAQAPAPQQAPGPGGHGGPRRGGGPGGPPPMRRGGPDGPRRMLQAGPGGRWWNNAEMAQRIGINSEQQKKMDDIFQANRLRLVDLNATLQKDEMILEPLLSSDSPEETKILAQIDKVAQARAELEKANARFLLGIRRVLTPEQWKKLQAERPAAGGPRGDRGPGPGGPGQRGPGGPDGGRRGPGGPPRH